MNEDQAEALTVSMDRAATALESIAEKMEAIAGYAIFHIGLLCCFLFFL